MGVWHEVVVKGPERVVRALVAGLEEGAGEHGQCVLAADLEMAGETVSGRLRTFLASADHVVVLAHPPFAERLVGVVSRRGGELGVKLEERLEVVSASFHFKAATVSEGVADEIRQAMLHALPDGVRVRDLDEATDRHPDARGTELYAPDHPFTYRASGTVEGPFPGVAEVHRRGVALEFVEVGPISLVTRPLAP